MRNPASATGILLYLAIGAVSTVVAAPKCVIVGEDDARVTYDGTPVTLPFIADDCARARRSSGQAEVCFGDGKGRASCQFLVTSGDVAGSSASSDDRPDAFISNLRLLLGGDARIRIGETRGTPKFDGLPYGDLALLDGELRISFDKIQVLEPRRFRLWAQDRGSEFLVDLPAPHGLVTIPVKKLGRGSRYVWEFLSNTGLQTGQFALLSAPALEDAGLEPLDSDRRDSVAWRARALVLAARCERVGLHRDAYQLVELARPATSSSSR